MAQWSHGDRTLFAKLVYYGPAFGGKTTNLESLHRITDPRGTQQLLTLSTVHDRTLFFDLLPFDLGDILGYQVALKVYTVPGQVRYDTTRQVVLAGADAVVFVADSSAERKDQNVWSLQNLRMNLRAKGMDPTKIPILYQYNKQDLPDCARPDDVAALLSVPARTGFAAVATEGRGVLETFMAACKKMLERVVSAADRKTRSEIDTEEMARTIDRTFAPHLARRAAGVDSEPIALPDPAATAGRSHPPVALEGDALLERSVETSVRLGERLTTANARVGRLEREAEAFRSLSERLRGLGASFDRASIVDSALDAVRETLGIPIVSLLQERGPGCIEADAVRGHRSDPLVAAETAQTLLAQLLASSEPCVSQDLVEALSGDAADSTESLRAVAGAPVRWGEEHGVMLAYAPQPDGSFSEQDLRFIATVAGHLAVGLEKSRLHAELAGRRDELEVGMAHRTEELGEAYASLRQMERAKDRFLDNLSHEMKTPLTAIISAAHAVRDYKSNAKDRREMAEAIVRSAEVLEKQLDELFRLVNLNRGEDPVERTAGEPRALIERAIQLSGHSGIHQAEEKLRGPATFDMDTLSRAVANLIDNAVKFSSAESVVKVAIGPGRLELDGEAEDAMAISVLDRGPGIAKGDRERIFAPFEQGGDPLTSKPRGVGLGLHEARIVALRHGGALEYLPRKGKGSEFRLTIPLRVMEPDHKTTPVDSTPEVSSGCDT
jgi:signal transduction histidine kinase/signal recognition particle receptor subunit beta